MPAPSVPFTQIDDLLRRAAELHARSGDAGAARFLNDHLVDPDVPPPTGDPDSPEYRDAQLEIYRRISGVEDYDPHVQEAHDAHVAERVRRPAPFCEGSMAAAGSHVIAYGFILRLLDLPAGAHLVEYGQGNGNIALLAGLMDVRVTTVDIAPDQVEIVRRRAAQLDVDVDAAVGEFGDAPPNGELADAVLFYEAFHHAADPSGVLRAVRERLAPGGCVAFAGEPIREDAGRPWLGEWGVRLDGLSVRAMRTLGCLELGFSESYFVRMLMRQGFVVRFHECRETGIGNTWIARPGDGTLRLNQLTLPPDEHVTWGAGHSDPAETHRFSGPASRVTLDEDPRWRVARVHLRNFLPATLAVDVAVGDARAAARVASDEQAVVEVALPAGRRVLHVRSETRSPAELGVGAETAQLGLAVTGIELA